MTKKGVERSEEEKLLRDWNKKFWKEENTDCKTCANDCKQSSKVRMVACPLYRKKEDAGTDR